MIRDKLRNYIENTECLLTMSQLGRLYGVSRQRISLFFLKQDPTLFQTYQKKRNKNMNAIIKEIKKSGVPNYKVYNVLGKKILEHAQENGQERDEFIMGQIFTNEK